MRDLLMLFNHDTRLALAAYNAGENAVTRYQGIPPFDETVDYVEKVMQLLELYRKEMVGV
jgi:soluble lytic murein transglycosylase-like protein